MLLEQTVSRSARPLLCLRELAEQSTDSSNVTLAGMEPRSVSVSSVISGGQPMIRALAIVTFVGCFNRGDSLDVNSWISEQAIIASRLFSNASMFSCRVEMAKMGVSPNTERETLPVRLLGLGQATLQPGHGLHWLAAGTGRCRKYGCA